MSIFDVSEDIKQEEERDVVAGQRLTTDIYPMKIKMVYMDKSDKGAHSVNIVGEINGAPYNEAKFITNRDGQNFFADKKTGEKRINPNFAQVTSMCELLLGKKLNQMTLEKKMVKIYNFKKRADEVVERDVMTELTGLTAHPAILKIIENKQVDDGTGKWVNDPTGATREKNEITKWFDEEKRTLPEKKAGKDAEFYNEWLKSNKGKDRNKVQKVAGAAGMPSGAEDTTEDLFGSD